jgi:hypothetical protein
MLYCMQYAKLESDKAVATSSGFVVRAPFVYTFTRSGILAHDFGLGF